MSEAARALSNDDLRDHLPALLDEIAEAADRASGGCREVKLPRKDPCLHAEHRLRNGFTLEEVTKEYAALRRIVLSKLQPRVGELNFGELVLLNQALDQAMIELVVAFSEGANAEAKGRAQFEKQLIGIVSHDLYNPISAILLGAKSLLQGKGLSEGQRGSISRIVSSAERASRMIRDLLDFTRARFGGGIRIKPAPFDLHEFTQQVVNEVRLAYEGREIRVDSQGDGRGEWDSDRIAQVITNLLSNALRYGSADAPIVVRTRGEDSVAIIEVHNAGDPIPKEQRAHLFEPMKRRLGGSANASGIGLGLYIVEQIVKAHRGEVAIQSDKKNGTTFTIKLPRWSAAPTET